MIWCIMTYIIAYVKTQKNKIHSPMAIDQSIHGKNISGLELVQSNFLLSFMSSNILVLVFLIYCGLVKLYCDIDLSQHWLR